MNLYVFLDTMIFLHYRAIDEIDLCNILGVQSATVVLPRITLRELDEQKNTHSSQKIRERARKVLLKIEEWDELGKPIKDRVSLEFYNRIPSIDFHERGLIPNWNDDQLLAAILQFQMDFPEKEVMLITQDSGPRFTARHLNIRVDRLTDEYLMATEADPLERENAALKRTVTRLTSALPRLEVCFVAPSGGSTFAKFVISKPPDLNDEEIKGTMDEVQVKFQKLSVPSRDDSSLHTTLAGELFRIPQEEYERYNSQVDHYLVEYERYLRDVAGQKVAQHVTIKFQFVVKNIGTAPADDVDVEFYFPDGFGLFTEEDLPSLPSVPKPPQQPQTKSQAMFSGFSPMRDIVIPSPFMGSLSGVDPFRLRRTNSYELTDQFERIKHGDSALFPELFLIFDSFDLASSFSCEYVLRPANLPEPITGKLHFVIEKQGD